MVEKARSYQMTVSQVQKFITGNEIGYMPLQMKEEGAGAERILTAKDASVIIKPGYLGLSYVTISEYGDFLKERARKTIENPQLIGVF